MKIRVLVFCCLFPFIGIAQTFLGKIIDKITQQPIETVAVYFDNTTIGTTTNANGEFSIKFTDAIQSTLVISYLGYEKVLISDYRNRNNITIELVEATNTLDEVVINYDDGLTRKQKLRLFRKEFLGTSKSAKSCKILNEDDLILRYDKNYESLYASSKVPVKVRNKALQYEIDFEIIDFEINFRYVEPEQNIFKLNKVTYFGTSFYKDLEGANKKKAIKNRDAAYKGSIQHFMRSLYDKVLKEEGYIFGKKGFKVNSYDFLSVSDVDEYGYKTIILKEKLDVFYKGNKESVIQVTASQFNIDKYGNYSPIPAVLFGGDMGNQRIGDTLPLNFGLATQD